MGLCQKCKQFIEPNIMFDINKDEQICVFCKLGKDTVTVQKEGKDILYTKKQAVRNYDVFLKQLKDSPSVKKKLEESDVIKVV